MSTQAKYTSITPLDFDLKVNFSFADTTVTTLSHRRYKALFPSKAKRKVNPFGYLMIESLYPIEPYESLTTGATKVRANILVIQGILTFFTRHIFTVHQAVHISNTVISSIAANSIKTHFKTEGLNLTSEIKTTLRMIASSAPEKQALLFTLFERWRKASYLFEESEDSLIHFDEGVLAYIHILEVLADEFKENLTVIISKNNDQIIGQVQKWIGQKQPVTDKKIRTLLYTYAQNQVTLRGKIIQMLHHFRMHSSKSEEIVKRYIGFRNAIAHGRRDLYQAEAVYPLLPFFSFVKDPYENFNIIRIFSARLIAKHLRVDLWKREWTAIIRNEMPLISNVKKFIKNQEYNSITKLQFLQGKYKGICPEVLSYYYTIGLIEYHELEVSLHDLIVSSKPDKLECEKLFAAAVTLADSQDAQLASKSQDIIKQVHNNNWSRYFNIKDVLNLYNYYKRDKVSWFKNWLTAGKP